MPSGFLDVLLQEKFSPSGNRRWEIPGKRIPIPETGIPEPLLGFCADALDVYKGVGEHDLHYIRFLSELKLPISLGNRIKLLLILILLKTAGNRKIPPAEQPGRSE
jgi:hypothetical protein